jgi:hypothetical protein
MLESRRINERRPEIGAESRPIAFRKRGFCFPLSDAGNRWAGERQKFLIALLFTPLAILALTSER